MLYRFIRMYPEEEWRRWRLCSGTSIAPQNPAFLSIPRSSLARYDTSSAAFRLLIYGEKVGKKNVSRGRNGELLKTSRLGTNPPPCLFETRKYALFPVLRGRNGELLYANQPISKPGITPIP